MNLRQLDYFLRTADLQSLSKASEELGISQSGLSKSIQALENEVRAPLFIRRSRGVELTDFGVTFQRHAITLRSQIRNAFSDLEALASGNQGTLNIGNSAHWMFKEFDSFILEFKKMHPKVKLRIVSGNALQLLDALVKGDIDIVFSLGEPAYQRPDIQVTVVDTVEQGLVVRHNHPFAHKKPKTLAELDKYGWVLPEQGTLFRRRLDLLYMTENRQMPQPEIETFSRSFMLSIVSQSDLIGIASRHEIDETMADKIAMLDYPFKWDRSVGIMTRRNETPSIILDDLIAQTRKYYASSTP